MKYAFVMLPLLALGILSLGTPQDSLRAEAQPAAKEKDNGRPRSELQLVEVSMVVLLPRKKDGLADVEKKLSAKMLQAARTKAKWTNVSMALPKFKLTEEFEPSAELEAMGMKDAFAQNAANFTGMLEKPNLQNPLFISAVVHKAFVDVHEEGTEAAAATAVVIKSVAFEGAPPPPVPFKADHPFLFLVRHNATGSILFMGRVNDPRG